MNRILKNKIISHSVLFCILLNISLCSLTLNSGIDLSAMFSCVADTITYSYNPIELTKGLKNNLLESLYKDTDKQNKTENNENTADKQQNKDLAIIPASSYLQIQTIKQFNKFLYEKLYTKDRWLVNNPSIDYVNSSFALTAFYFMLLGWLAVIFRKKWNFTIYKESKKTV